MRHFCCAVLKLVNERRQNVVKDSAVNAAKQRNETPERNDAD